LRVVWKSYSISTKSFPCAISFPQIATMKRVVGPFSLRICTSTQDPNERAALDRSRIVYFFLSGSWNKYDVPETAARLIRLVPKMAAQTELAASDRFELPINAGSKLRPHRN
jgi:hypothetical protein